ncbi:ferredoxin [Streptomyces sp. ME19-01-6]|uniref:ferredoxin n=1 Tax=Streptomyces sp. ME19-01-6 TaxID=3028686 RepID=UPI0039F602F1
MLSPEVFAQDDEGLVVVLVEEPAGDLRKGVLRAWTCARRARCAYSADRLSLPRERAGAIFFLEPHPGEGTVGRSVIEEREEGPVVFQVEGRGRGALPSAVQVPLAAPAEPPLVVWSLS